MNMIQIETKTDAVRLFGSQRQLALALGISGAAVCQWPETLRTRTRHEVIGAAVEAGVIRCTCGTLEQSAP